MSYSFTVGFIESYIYIWFSKECALVYVGQTNNVYGVIGRGCQHVTQGSGTLYQRLYGKGYDLNEMNDLVLLSYPLPREQRFLSEETSYRISVEYLVQKGLIEKRILCSKPFNLISNVTPGPYCGLKGMENIASEIINDFLNIYNES